MNWSHFARDNQLDLPIEQVEQLYTAMRAYDDLLEENHIKLKDHFRYLASGRSLTFDPEMFNIVCYMDIVMIGAVGPGRDDLRAEHPGAARQVRAAGRHIRPPPPVRLHGLGRDQAGHRHYIALLPALLLSNNFLGANCC